jgi:hypothetical protein
LSAAATDDSQNRSKHANKQCSVYAHDLYDYGDNDASVNSNGESYNIDYPVQSIVHDWKFNPNFKRENQFKQCTPRMSRDKWFALSEEARERRDKLDDKEKAIILGICPPPSGPTKSTT